MANRVGRWRRPGRYQPAGGGGRRPRARSLGEHGWPRLAKRARGKIIDQIAEAVSARGGAAKVSAPRAGWALAPAAPSNPRAAWCTWPPTWAGRTCPLAEKLTKEAGRAGVRGERRPRGGARGSTPTGRQGRPGRGRNLGGDGIGGGIISDGKLFRGAPGRPRGKSVTRWSWPMARLLVRATGCVRGPGQPHQPGARPARRRPRPVARPRSSSGWRRSTRSE